MFFSVLCLLRLCACLFIAALRSSAVIKAGLLALVYGVLL